MTAQRIAERELADVVLIDVVEGLPQGKGLDMEESAPVLGFDAAVTGTQDYAACEGSEIVVITAGLARRPGMSRDDLVAKNAEIVGGIADRVKQNAPGAVLVMVTNPLDVMTTLAWKRTGFDVRRVMGMAGVLDTARFRAFIAAELGVSVKDVQAMVLGGHGDSMVPLPRYCAVSGIPLGDLLGADRIESLIERTRNGGAEIVSLLKTGSAYYAPSAAVAEMVEGILLDQHRILPVAAYLDGQYGIEGVFVGVPARIGRPGVEEILELELTEEELASLRESASHVAAMVQRLGLT
jgi:malate dehydrogenase